jgi:hypothetical protein
MIDEKWVEKKNEIGKKIIDPEDLIETIKSIFFRCMIIYFE